MSSNDCDHSTAIELLEPGPLVVLAGEVVTLKIKVSCARGCDLTGIPIKIAAKDSAFVQTEFAINSGRNDVTEVKFEAPSRIGNHIWTVTFGPHEVAEICHDVATIDTQITIQPHTTSLAVWSVPSPVLSGEEFAIAVGAKSSAGIALAAELLWVRDESGEVVAQGGGLGDSPYPGTTALYWTNVELVAPRQEGLHTWSVEIEPKGPDLPHERGSATFSFVVVRPPEHRLVIKLVERDTSTPIADAQVRLGAYRATTDMLGLAEVDMPEGVYDLNIWKAGYEVRSTTVQLDRNMLVEVDALTVPDEDPDAAWLM